MRRGRFLEVVSQTHRVVSGGDRPKGAGGASEASGGGSSPLTNHVSWFSPGTGVRISHTELAMPRERVMAM
jgi:hypothetical protein